MKFKTLLMVGLVANMVFTITADAAQCPSFDEKAAVSDEAIYGVAGKLAPGVSGIAERRLAQLSKPYVGNSAAFWQEVQAKAQAAWSACKGEACVGDLLKREALVNQSQAHLAKLAEVPECQGKLEAAENALVSRQFAIQALAGSSSPEADGWAIGEFLYGAKFEDVQAHFSGI